MSALSAHERRRLTQREQSMTDDEVHDAAFLAAREFVDALLACRDAYANQIEAEVFDFWLAAHERRRSRQDAEGAGMITDCVL